MTQGDLQKTDQIIVDVVNTKLKITPPLSVDDINRSHIIGNIKKARTKVSSFLDLKTGKKNLIYMS